MSDNPPPRTTQRPVEPRTNGWVIGRIAGAPVILTPSWFVAAVILTVLFAPTVRNSAPDLSGSRIYLVAFAFVLLLFVSVFCHEVAHALMARARGQRVTELALTLWGGHTSYVGGGGRPLDGLLISVVGPVTNLALAGALWAGFNTQPRGSIAALLLFAGAFSNAFVGFFNLLPGLPLDGGQILESIVWAATGVRSKGTVAAGWVGRAVALGVVGWALWPLIGGGRLSMVTFVWTALIAGFLWSGAGQALRASRARTAVEDITVRALASPALTVPATASVADAGAAVARAGGPHVIAVVLDGGRPVAFVDPEAARTVPVDLAAGTPVMAAAVPLPPVAVTMDAAGRSLLARLGEVDHRVPMVAVLDRPADQGGQVVAVLEIARVVSALTAISRG